MSKETFDFSEALRRMKEGKWVRRHGCYFNLSINKDKISILHQQSSAESFINVVSSYWNFFSLNDILATDWEEAENETTTESSHNMEDKISKELVRIGLLRQIRDYPWNSLSTDELENVYELINK